MRNLRTGLLAVIAAGALACGGGGMDSEMESEEMPEPEPAAEAEEMSGPPRVFFVSPADGDEISVDIGIHFEFGAENYEVGAVPETVEQVREGVGHYHLGVDQDCMPAGEIIPQGLQSWVHFGDGSNTFELQHEPGRYKFSLQMADDEHRTIEGLCETIEVELADGI